LPLATQLTMYSMGCDLINRVGQDGYSQLPLENLFLRTMFNMLVEDCVIYYT